jgi:hypothetical protein
MNTTLSFARASILFAALALLALISLHFLSPEFDPSWRMISEYARGNYGWMLSLMFSCWAISTWMLALATFRLIKKKGGLTGSVFLIAAGLGEAMASVFSIDHPLHDLAGMLGILCLPIASLLITRELRHKDELGRPKKSLFWMANLPWISLVLFIASMIIMYIQFTKAGGQLSTHVTKLPSGVTGLNGWANRFLVMVYCSWAISAAWFITHLKTKEFHYETATA